MPVAENRNGLIPPPDRYSLCKLTLDRGKLAYVDKKKSKVLIRIAILPRQCLVLRGAGRGWIEGYNENFASPIRVLRREGQLSNLVTDVKLCH